MYRVAFVNTRKQHIFGCVVAPALIYHFSRERLQQKENDAEMKKEEDKAINAPHNEFLMWANI